MELVKDNMYFMIFIDVTFKDIYLKKIFVLKKFWILGLKFQKSYEFGLRSFGNLALEVYVESKDFSRLQSVSRI